MARAFWRTGWLLAAAEEVVACPAREHAAPGDLNPGREPARSAMPRIQHPPSARGYLGRPWLFRTSPIPTGQASAGGCDRLGSEDLLASCRPRRRQREVPRLARQKGSAAAVSD